MPVTHRYIISAKNPPAHLFEVSVSVASPDLTGQAFQFPAWIPGSYMIRDPARRVVAIRAESSGRDVALEKIDKHTWRAARCEGPLTLTAEIIAFDLQVRGVYLDTEHGFFDGACVFPVVLGQEDAACHLEIVATDFAKSAAWQIATSMRPLDITENGYGRYAVAHYAELIDHPVEMGRFRSGEFEVRGVTHKIVVSGEQRFDMTRLCEDLATLCDYQLAFLGKPQDLDRYVFLLRVRENGYGGLEHGWSSSLMCSRSDLPKRDAVKVSDGYRKFLGLCSHEYFHLWNIKRMKPERFVPYRLDAESHTGLLWVFEGITSYYDDLCLVRCGLISVSSYLELLGKTITRVQRTRGRLRQTMEESSFDAWTKLYKPDANSSNTVISYYTKGSLVALALDLTIRHETGGTHSLDDVIKTCWARYGQTGRGMPERGIESIAVEVTGIDLGDFFDRFVRGTSDLPLERFLATHGVTAKFRAAGSRNDVGGKPGTNEHRNMPWLGAVLTRRNDTNRISVVHADSPAEKAGLAPGDEAVAIDGLRLTATNVDSRIRDYEPADTVSVTVFRDHKLMHHRVTLELPPEDTCFLVLDETADAESQSACDRWLSSY